jgi:hypothetical protein
MRRTDMAYKIKQHMQYSETVFYDDNDIEVGRERNYDDFWYDSDLPEPLEDWEIDQYGESDDED